MSRRRLTAGATLLLRGLQQQDQVLLDSVANLDAAIDELIKRGLMVNEGTRIVDYSYVTSVSLTGRGKGVQAVSPTEKLQKEMAKLGNGISSFDLDRCLQRAGLRLVDEKTYENFSWTESPERMGR